MKWWLVFPVIFLVLVQTTIINFNFLLVLILLLALLGAVSEAVVFAFLGGLLLDLSAGTKLGFSSIGFLIPIGIILAYSRRFQIRNFFFWLVIFPLSLEIFDFLLLGNWQLKEGIIFLAIGLVFYISLSRFGILEGKEEGIRLKM